jgi:hypothetical protein
MIIGTLGFPFLFISAWSAIPVMLSIVVPVVRTHIEDARLEREPDYKLSTRFRFVPGVW